jgi:glycine/D-amino acid oxidase-like deaminating enzyme
VWLATGHEGLGITTALATAELLAADFTGVQSAVPSEPYLPGRFAAAADLENVLAGQTHQEKQ